GGAFGMIEAAGRVDGAICGDAILPGYDVIFLPMAGGRVDSAGTLLEGDVIGENAERIAIEEWVTEDGVLDGGSGELGDNLEILPAAFLGSCGEQIIGNDIDVTGNIRGHILELRMEGDRHVGGNGPGRRGPDQAIDFAAGERGIDL